MDEDLGLKLWIPNFESIPDVGQDNGKYVLIDRPPSLPVEPC